MSPDGSPNHKKAHGGDGHQDDGSGTPAIASATIATPLVGQLYRLVLRARDAYGNTVHAGGAQVEVHVAEPPVEPGSEYDHILAAKLECLVHDISNGLYHIDLTVARPGSHTMTVRLDGVEVLGSPLSIVAVKPKVFASLKSAGKSRGETLYAVGAAIANAGINWAFKSWEEWSYEVRDKLELLESVARKLKNADVAACWIIWREVSDAKLKARQALRFAIRALTKQWLRFGLNSWVDFADSRRRNRELLMRALGAFSSIGVHCCFNTWYANIYPEKADDHHRASFNSGSFKGGGLIDDDDVDVSDAPDGG